MKYLMYTLLASGVFILGMASGSLLVYNDSFTDGYNIGYQEGYNKGYLMGNATMVDVLDHSFYRMRDLFTSMPNDTVTVETAGYLSDRWHIENGTAQYRIRDGGYCFWVNHSQVLSSYFFDDQRSYLVLFADGDSVDVISPSVLFPGWNVSGVLG